MSAATEPGPPRRAHPVRARDLLLWSALALLISLLVAALAIPLLRWFGLEGPA